jgi:hypothetical protein
VAWAWLHFHAALEGLRGDRECDPVFDPSI